MNLLKFPADNCYTLITAGFNFHFLLDPALHQLLTEWTTDIYYFTMFFRLIDNKKLFSSGDDCN